MKKSGRKLLGILLAASMAVTAIAPIQGMAANQEEHEYETVEQEKEPKGEVLEKVLEQEKQPVAEEEEMEGKGLRDAQAEEEGTPKEELQEEVKENEGSKMEQFLAPEGAGEETQPPTEGSYDINQPVIESFEFEENGQTLTVDDTLHFKMKAYDADSGIASVYVEIYCNDTYSYVTSVRLEKSEEEEKLYTGEVPCSQLKENNFYIGYIKVTDYANNYVYWETSGENGPLYTFTLDQEIEEVPISVTNFQMEANPSNEDGKLRVNDTVTYTADITCNEEVINYIETHITGPYANNTWHGDYFVLDYNSDTQKLMGTYTVTEFTYPGEWEWDHIGFITESGKFYCFDPSKIEPEADLKFTVVQEGYDTEKPLIESITLDKNKEFVQAGDVVTLTVKVQEAHPSNNAYAYFHPQVSYVSSSEYVSLELNEATMEYTGRIEITEDTYPCEWAMTELYISDEMGNEASLYDYQNDWSNTYPWYYKVKSGGQYREDLNDITFYFYGFAEQGDGSFQAGSLISTVDKKAGRRDTLKGLGISLPEPPAENVSITEWKRGYWVDGTTITEDTELFFGNSIGIYHIMAVYDKGCANVSLTYMADSGKKEAMVPVFVDKGATYKDVLGLLELPEDAIKDEFAGFKFSDSYYDETAQVGDCSYISVEAKYKGCQVAWNTRCLGQDGKEASKVTTKSYVEGTSLSDALAELPEPEGAEGLEFDKWVLVSPGADETLTQPMASLDVVAAYKGKTTVDAAYAYRGEDGAIAEGSKMVLVEGEALSDAEVQGGASEAFKDVGHYKGLALSEWAGSIGLSLERYKKVQFQALYSNCVAIFKYPDGSVQYVVVDKGAEFPLPTENERYQEIVWEGYAKGEAVAINEDKEFIAKEYQLKGGGTEPGGVRLPADEVAKITAEIQNAQAGASIRIDMKKATVVPKEVLEAVQGKEVDIILDMGGYSWTIGGTEVLASNLKDVDLEVKVGVDAVPSGLVSSIAEGKPTTQLSLTHNGDFGFRADLSLNLGSENSGGTSSLYYYDSSGKLIFMNAGKIGADGRTSLSFSHASDYVIVVEKAAPPATDKEEGTDKKEGTEENDAVKDGPKDNEGMANIKKRDNNTTADTGKVPPSTAGTTGSGALKSPKTGE